LKILFKGAKNRRFWKTVEKQEKLLKNQRKTNRFQKARKTTNRALFSEALENYKSR
jgi:hypothetical protein